MAAHTCPSCTLLAPKRLLASNIGRIANVFRCTKCAHVWSRSRDASHAVHHVTEPPALKPEPL